MPSGSDAHWGTMASGCDWGVSAGAAGAFDRTAHRRSSSLRAAEQVHRARSLMTRRGTGRPGARATRTVTSGAAVNGDSDGARRWHRSVSPELRPRQLWRTDAGDDPHTVRDVRLLGRSGPSWVPPFPHVPRRSAPDRDHRDGGGVGSGRRALYAIWPQCPQQPAQLTL
jgi:hypothetical protein